MNTVQSDFDRIARLDTPAWDHNRHYHPFLLQMLAPRIGEALDIGCGKGDFARLLAARTDRVLAIDLSPEMVRVAREQSLQYPNIQYQVADVLNWEWSHDRFDCIASIATLHHLPLGGILSRIKQALRPGGKLLVLDLFHQENPSFRDVWGSIVHSSRNHRKLFQGF
jgi:2-polyprenyl-3-methyl-5-hydroxy-6-metoxy-1,4-benzoquinol methylase